MYIQNHTKMSLGPLWNGPSFPRILMDWTQETLAECEVLEAWRRKKRLPRACEISSSPRFGPTGPGPKAREAKFWRCSWEPISKFLRLQRWLGKYRALTSTVYTLFFLPDIGEVPLMIVAWRQSKRSLIDCRNYAVQERLQRGSKSKRLSYLMQQFLGSFHALGIFCIFLLYFAMFRPITNRYLLITKIKI